MNQGRKRDINRTKRLAREFAEAIRELDDEDVPAALGSGGLNDVLEALLDPKTASGRIGDYFLRHKNRATMIALLRHAITQNYAIRSTNGEGYVSPHFVQWFDDGVALLEGPERFAGLICAYRNGQSFYAIAAHDIRPTEAIGPENLEFIPLAAMRSRAKAIPPAQLAQLDQPVTQLRQLLAANNNDESAYQELLQRFPWVWGLNYKQLDRHVALSEKYKPDFLATRARDGALDIIEVKPPFAKLFTQADEPSADLRSAWEQAERYADYVSQEQHMLARKGLRFSAPVTFLLAGVALSDAQAEVIRRLERTRRNLTVITYDQLLALAENTVTAVRRLTATASPAAPQPQQTPPPDTRQPLVRVAL